MRTEELLRLFRQAPKRAILVGTPDHGAVIGLDLEARIYYSHHGEIVSRVNPEAIAGFCGQAGYLNPGGDGLWAAPEGSCFGYCYDTAIWRVPPGLIACRFLVESTGENQATVSGDVDLVNASGVGFPLRFRREVTVTGSGNRTELCVVEGIEYLGTQTRTPREFRLAPWSLSQFDGEPGATVIFPNAAPVRDLYTPGRELLTADGELRRLSAWANRRYQIAIGPEAEWIKLTLPSRHLIVRRQSAALPAGMRYTDIADSDPRKPPQDFATRYSVYTDSSGFLEVEASGGSHPELAPGEKLELTITTLIEG